MTDAAEGEAIGAAGGGEARIGAAEADCFLDGGAFSRKAGARLASTAAAGDDKGTEGGGTGAPTEKDAGAVGEVAEGETVLCLSALESPPPLPPAVDAAVAFFASFSRSQLSKARLKECETERVTAWAVFFFGHKKAWHSMVSLSLLRAMKAKTLE